MANPDRGRDLSRIRKLVRGVGVVKGVWRLSLAELRGHSRRLVEEKVDWVTPRERALLERFISEG